MKTCRFYENFHWVCGISFKFIHYDDNDSNNERKGDNNSIDKNDNKNDNDDRNIMGLTNVISW